MKLYIKYLLIAPFFFLIAGCMNNNSKQTAQKDSDTVSIPITPHIPVSKEVVSGKQFKEDVVKEDDAATGIIADIRDEYQRIQKLLNDGKLRKEVIKFECKNDPGSGNLVRYYENNKMVLMDYLVNSEHWWEKKRVYMKDGKTFFVFEQDGTWMFGGPTSNTEYSNTIDKIKERRYYINNGELIRQLNKEFEDKSWEEKVTSDRISNKTVEVKSGEVYPNAAEVNKMKKGIVSC